MWEKNLQLEKYFCMQDKKDFKKAKHKVSKDCRLLSKDALVMCDLSLWDDVTLTSPGYVISDFNTI